jgi:hypothetical protein
MALKGLFFRGLKGRNHATLGPAHNGLFEIMKWKASQTCVGDVHHDPP